MFWKFFFVKYNFTENGFPVDLKDIKNVDEPLIVLTGKEMFYF